MHKIDKNDVDIAKLFSWKKEYVLSTPNGPVTVYIRLVGDAELNRARVFALRKSAEFRRALNDINADERIAYIPEADSLDTKELLNALLVIMVREFGKNATDSVKIPLPIEPDPNASLEEQEKYQAELDAYPTIREAAIRDYIEKSIAQQEEYYKDFPKDKLYKEFVQTSINQLCEAEMLQKFREMCAYFGCYIDKEYKTRICQSMDDFLNLPTDIKNQLISRYIELEIDGEVLKNLPEVTQ